MGFMGFTGERTTATTATGPERRARGPRRRPVVRMAARTAAGPDLLEGRVLFSTAVPNEVSVLWKGTTAPAYQGQYLVETGNYAKFQKLAAAQGFTGLKSLGGNGFYEFTTTAAVADVQKLSRATGLGFKAIQPNYVLAYQSVVPDDTLFGSQWGLDNTGQLESYDYNGNGLVTPYDLQADPSAAGTATAFPSPPNPDENQYGVAGDDIDATQAWGVTTGSKSVVIADLDSGLDITNPDIAGNVWTNPLDTAANGDDGDGYPGDIHGYNVGDNNDDLTDDVGHGTSTAGIIGASGDNGMGVTGVAWNVSLLMVKLGDTPTDASEIAGINYVINLKDHGINVVAMNESLSGADFPVDVLERDSIREAGAAGILDVVAAGNASTNLDGTVSNPGQLSTVLSNVVTVAAVDNQFKLAQFSNYGADTVDLAAPGINILSTEPVEGGFSDETSVTSPYDIPAESPLYGYESGTSQATPMVTGVVALMAAANPSATPAELKAALLESVTPDPNLVGQNGRPNLVRTGGVVNAYKAVLDIRDPFVGADTTRQGSWVGFYGTQGAYVVGDTTSLSTPFVTATQVGGSPVIVQNDSSNPAALQRATDPARRVSAYEGAAVTESIDLDFTDGLSHRTRLYLYDADKRKRSEVVSVVDAATGTVLDTRGVADFTKGEYLSWDLQGAVDLVITDNSGTGAGAAYSGLFFDPTDDKPVTALSTDGSTAGSAWRNTYGSQGDYIYGDNNVNTLPAYVTTFSNVGGTLTTLKADTGDTHALQRNYDLTHNIEAYESAAGHQDINVGFSDSILHTVTLYLADYNNKKRAERVQVIDAASGTVLVTQDFPSFKNGLFVSYNVTGSVTFRITRTAGPDAVVSGVFFDAPFGENAHFAGTDATTRGTWRTAPYGSTDAYVVGDDFPGLDTVANSVISITGASRAILAGSTTNATALNRTDSADSGDRVEAYASTTSSMTISYNPGDYVQHQVALYFADFENFRRTESITITNVNNPSGPVLSHQVLTNFRRGKYLLYDISGPVLITINSESYPNAVLSGLFVD